MMLGKSAWMIAALRFGKSWVMFNDSTSLEFRMGGSGWCISFVVDGGFTRRRG